MVATAETCSTCLIGVVQLGREAAQFVIPVALAPERQRENGNVIDRARLDQRLRGARRNQVEVGEHLLVQPHDGSLFVLADEEAHHGHGPAGAGSRVDVLDAGNLPQQLLHGLGDALLDFTRGGAGHLDEDVDHGDDDLRLLFAGKFDHCEDAQKNRGQHEERCEFGVDEGGGEPPGGAEAGSVVHLAAS